ncbi:MAG TPA: cation diffusion facilitator family transporter [Ferruginibacter sp.]|jgi:cation diffusion facilitator family transporter|nr:cation transporter [Bacteroidota bacterium]MCC6692757.1 cation transporter [Chitinophagaceae bacterium]HMT97540.1 cation diffusion facilitator family transporter [Ferruginibacter sp.]HMU25476.1 cation diffusion facilitator family transporter [Ferruginibacter sp.]
MQSAQQNLKIQKAIALLSVVLFLVKIFAWYLTASVAILTDALESIVNMAASFLGVYSLYVSAKPKDADHPYGHGKVEFISASVEGTLIIVAGFFAIYQAIEHLWDKNTVTRLDKGIYLVAGAALLNYIAGSICVKTGKKNNSLALVSSGKHLISDTYTTIGIIAGLILLYFTNLKWIDSAVAILFAFIIIYTGYKIIRSSIAGIMDEADEELLNDMVQTLNESRSENWIDLHNIRIIKYGATLHLDGHLTIPWYFNVREAHNEIDSLSELVKNKYGQSMELFVHSDACMDFSCFICSKQNCAERKHPFEKRVEWTVENIRKNRRHQLSTDPKMP